MPHNNRAQKLDANSKPVDQYFNNTTDQYEVQTGSNGAKNVSLVGSTIPQGQEIPMKILGCNTSQDYLVGAVVTAGTSTPILENVDIDGNEIGVGVRLSAARKYKVSIVPKTMSGLNTDNDAF
ncbi:hypothetical protein, partial [Streptomyces sp. NPDC021562]|uniref:hypothetical protein n=1 Tax=Streptomyces sp. NPDC021562 TaxID=3155121 RepID=UPI00340E1144